MSVRKPVEIIPAQAASDGDGVKLMRVFGGRGPERFDPFLMLDEFGSKEAADYIGGFPSHPHRGFETVTYMLRGKMEHRDHLGNVGLLNDGDVQWMTAGRGIIHSEMPLQTEGQMRGFQLWLNLPASEKMTAPRYQDVPAKELPVYNLEKIQIIAIAGASEVGGRDVSGHIERASTDALFWDVHLDPGAELDFPVAQGHTVMIYVYEGEAHIAGTAVKAQQLARLSEGGSVSVRSGNEETRVLVLAGRPLGEPIVQYGPFVMNTPEEIEQALQDYREGRLASDQ